MRFSELEQLVAHTEAFADGKTRECDKIVLRVGFMANFVERRIQPGCIVRRLLVVLTSDKGQNIRTRARRGGHATQGECYLARAYGGEMT